MLSIKFTDNDQIVVKLSVRDNNDMTVGDKLYENYKDRIYVVLVWGKILLYYVRFSFFFFFCSSF